MKSSIQGLKAWLKEHPLQVRCRAKEYLQSAKGYCILIM